AGGRAPGPAAAGTAGPAAASGRRPAGSRSRCRGRGPGRAVAGARPHRAASGGPRPGPGRRPGSPATGPAQPPAPRPRNSPSVNPPAETWGPVGQLPVMSGKSLRTILRVSDGPVDLTAGDPTDTPPAPAGKRSTAAAA